jgi:hypothetical protein
MQRVTIVRYTTNPGRAGENEALARAVFTELRSKPRQPFAYAVLRQGDDFLHLFLNLEADDADGVVELPSFKAFTAAGEDRWAAPPQIARDSMRLLDAYGFEGATAPA